MEYKHFSHNHGLIVHQLPGESQITCSGCKFPGTGSVYACWPCSFFLHEQCFHAARSINHPSHPAHPLNLVPYPTYPSNSFFCNSCNLVGTGLSYSCSNCEFDTHVHCAYVPNSTTTHESYPSSMTLNYPIRNEPIISQNNPIPIYPPHNYDAMPNSVPQMSGTVGYPHQTSQPQYVAFPTEDQVPKTNFFPNEPIPVNDHTPVDHSRHYETIPSYNPQMGGTMTDQHQAGQPQYVPYPVEDQVPKTNFFPNDPIPVNDHIPIDHSRHYETIPSFNPQMGGTSATLAPPVLDKPQGYLDEDQTLRKKQIKHFSHCHPLRLSEFQEEDSIVCSGCEEVLLGSGYSCITSKCDFHLHKSCFELAQELKHESHLEHPLVLLSSPPYKEHGEFTCNACLNVGSSFTYHCKACQYDLHVNCASLPKTVKREDHEHALVLLYSSPYKKPAEDEEALSFSCDVCHKIADERCWVYYCKECDFGTHLECVSTSQDSSEPQTYEESLIAAQNQMQLLKFQMEMSRQNAEFMASLGKSMLSLV